MMPFASGQHHIDGFEAPIHGSLGQAILLGGAPRGLAIVNGTIAAAMGLGLQQWLIGLVLWVYYTSFLVIYGSELARLQQRCEEP